MPGLVPGIYVFAAQRKNTWMAGTSPAMTEKRKFRLSRVPLRQPQPRLDFGDLGPAHRHPVRGRAVEFDDGALALLADESHMRHRHDVAAVHPHEQAGVELRLGLRDRPRAHPLPGAV